jgi:hypothetical protein
MSKNMRKLTVSQKKILDQQAVNGIRDWDGLPREVIEEIEAINNTEILWQEVNRYLWDAYWMQGKRGLKKEVRI